MATKRSAPRFEHMRTECRPCAGLSSTVCGHCHDIVPARPPVCHSERSEVRSKGQSDIPCERRRGCRQRVSNWILRFAQNDKRDQRTLFLLGSLSARPRFRVSVIFFTPPHHGPRLPGRTAVLPRSVPTVAYLCARWRASKSTTQLLSSSVAIQRGFSDANSRLVSSCRPPTSITTMPCGVRRSFA